MGHAFAAGRRPGESSRSLGRNSFVGEDAAVPVQDLHDSDFGLRLGSVCAAPGLGPTLTATTAAAVARSMPLRSRLTSRTNSSWSLAEPLMMSGSRLRTSIRLSASRKRLAAQLFDAEGPLAGRPRQVERDVDPLIDERKRRLADDKVLARLEA